MVNGHFDDDSILIILDDKEMVNNTLECIHTFNETSGSNLQLAKTQCYRLSQEVILHWLLIRVGSISNLGKFLNSLELPFL